MLPWEEIDWQGLWGIAVGLGWLLLAYAVLTLVIFLYKMFSPEAKRKRQRRMALMARHGWDGKEP